MYKLDRGKGRGEGGGREGEKEGRGKGEGGEREGEGRGGNKAEWMTFLTWPPLAARVDRVRIS